MNSESRAGHRIPQTCSRVLAFALCALALAGAALAQSTGGSYKLGSQTIAGGGGHSAGGSLALDTYQLTGGFQQQPAVSGNVFSNGFE